MLTFIAILSIANLTATIVSIVMNSLKDTPDFYINGEPMKKGEAVTLSGERGIVNRKGSIYMPPSDVETVREQIIEKNREQGKDTPISELL